MQFWNMIVSQEGFLIVPFGFFVYIVNSEESIRSDPFQRLSFAAVFYGGFLAKK